jgi:hypothetical protein
MYYDQMELSLLSLAWKLGWHPSTLAHMSSITISNFVTWVPIQPFNHVEDYYWQLTIIICYLYVL